MFLKVLRICASRKIRKKTIRISKNQLRGLKLLCKLDWKASGQAILEPRGP